MGRYFGTDGFRGEAGVKITADHAYKIGRFIGNYFSAEHKAKIVIGKDTRLSGDMLEGALVSGLMASGADAYLLHVTTTPSVSYLIKEDGFDCGAMISASHNPYYDNGIKLINARGEKIEADIEEKIEDYIDGKIQELPFASGSKIGRSIDYSAGRDKYIQHLICAAEAAKKQDVRIGIDCAHGSASALAGQLFEALGIDAHIINNTPDGINMNEACGSTHLEALKKFVLENKLDAGFAYDGDADRCLAVDENGNEVDGDKIMYICVKYLNLNQRLAKNTVVTTVMSNIGLYKSFEKAGIAYATTDVGDKYVSEEMISGGYCLGGEQSGHIIFGEFASTGDGMLTSLMLLEAMRGRNKSLKELSDEVEIYPQLLQNIRVKDKKAVLANKRVAAAVKEVENELADGGRILVRMSGTEPLIRVMVEAKSDEICAKNVKYIIDTIRSEEPKEK